MEKRREASLCGRCLFQIICFTVFSIGRDWEELLSFRGKREFERHHLGSKAAFPMIDDSGLKSDFETRLYKPRNRRKDPAATIDNLRSIRKVFAGHKERSFPFLDPVVHGRIPVVLARHCTYLTIRYRIHAVQVVAELPRDMYILNEGIKTSWVRISDT
jgi:hypothetical protein